MHIGDYMSPAPVTIRADTDYGEAFGIMEAKNLHHLPVTNASEEIVGLVTRRDLQVAARVFREAPVEVGQVMHTPVQTVSPGTSLVDAIDLMIDQRIGCLPVTEDGQHLVGIITETDLLGVLKRQLST